jgi:hypothetical protein
MTKSDQMLIKLSAAHALSCLAFALKGATAQPLRWMLVEEAIEALETVETVADVTRDAFAPSMLFSSATPNMWSDCLPVSPSASCRAQSAEMLQAV